jgi:endoglucanase
MTIKIKELNQLVKTRGPSGDEFDVAELYADLVEPHVDTVQTDASGNVIATDQGADDAPEIMLAAHTDELAFMIDEITDDGFLRFSWLGAHYPGNFAGQDLEIGPDRVPGVIGPKSRHRMDEEYDGLPEEWYIDLGVDSAEAARELNIRVGDYATWDQGMTELANGRFSGRAMDDRVGLAVLLAVARTADPKATVHYVATVQEEPGLRGAEMTGYELDPDIAIAVDIFPGNHPGDDDRVEVPLGQGPAVELAEGVGDMLNGVLVNRQVREWLTRAGKQADVETQPTVFQDGFTDARALQIVRGGRHAGVVSVPCRYTHSPVETFQKSDADETVALLSAAVETPFPSREESR